VAATPVQVLGCRNRGWLAVAIAFASVLLSLGTAIMGTKGRLQGDPHTLWWFASTVILAIPAVALIILA
jgi:hypothetical protein